MEKPRVSILFQQPCSVLFFSIRLCFTLINSISFFYEKHQTKKNNFITIHSLSHTGNEWYDAPAYPFLALLFGSSLYVLYEKLEHYFIKFPEYFKTSIIACLIILLFFYPYKKIIESISNKNPYIYSLELEGTFMKKLHEVHPSLNQYTVCCSGLFSDQVHFYQAAYNHQGADIKISNSRNFKDGEIVLSCQPDNLNYIFSHYHCTIIEIWNQCRLLKIGKQLKYKQ